MVRPSRVRSSRRLAARAVSWLTIFGLLGLLAMPMMGDAGGASVMSVCTDQGDVQVLLYRQGQPVPPQPGHHHQACPFCLAHGGFTLLPTLASLPAAPVATGAAVVAFPQAVVARLLFLSAHRSRAPPVQAA